MTAGTDTETITDIEKHRLEALSPDALERETVEAIREHRRLVAADEVVYHEWKAAQEAHILPADQIEHMKDECLRRRRKTLDQQSLLNFMVDQLGFMPKVPAETEQLEPVVS